MFVRHKSSTGTELYYNGCCKGLVEKTQFLMLLYVVTYVMDKAGYVYNIVLK